MNFLKIKNIFLICISIVLTFLFIQGFAFEKTDIIIGGKDYTEQDILVNILGDYIEENTNLKVNKKPYLGGSSIVANSIISSNIDIMVEYTGTGLVNILKKPADSNSKRVLNLVQKEFKNKYNLIWNKPLGFNNTWCITMDSKKAKELDIHSISDLKEKSYNLVFASTQEFLERPDGFSKMSDKYRLKFKNIKAMDPGLCYLALKEGQADVSLSFATDGRIPAFGFTILEDDLSFFPPYDACILISKKTLDKFPILNEKLKKLEGLISNEEMAKLNAQVDLEHKTSSKVAHEWLIEKKLIKKN